MIAAIVALFFQQQSAVEIRPQYFDTEIHCDVATKIFKQPFGEQEFNPQPEGERKEEVTLLFDFSDFEKSKKNRIYGLAIIKLDDLVVVGKAKLPSGVSMGWNRQRPKQRPRELKDYHGLISLPPHSGANFGAIGHSKTVAGQLSYQAHGFEFGPHGGGTKWASEGLCGIKRLENRK